MEDVLRLHRRDVQVLVGQLRSQNFAWIQMDFDPEEGFSGAYVEVLPNDYPTWPTIRSFLNDADKLRELVVELRFDHLD